ncbi:MAG: hypothetical protein AMQ22_01088 [Candidatus Methanofastidiosum methylothiophilum]|uniref:Uncharacterized protein n=1 Tax=Candidatus Methanofastidiosum methylothiophilum TaxID=1705564 RepID=A0A150J401_9EURY|nr:MAG: hypothetical protein AMQ22_01088 [Candidatus Methanofastidiosum methylthiophilus]
MRIVKRLIFILMMILVVCLPSTIMAAQEPEEETTKYLDVISGDDETLTLSQKEMTSLKSEIVELRQNVEDIKQETDTNSWKYWVSVILGIIIIILEVVFKIKPIIPTTKQSSNYQT